MSSTQVIPPEHISYVHCNFCNTILAVSIVSVPGNSLFNSVTVRCGHCSNLLSVDVRALIQTNPFQGFPICNIESQGNGMECGLPSKSTMTSLLYTMPKDQEQELPIRAPGKRRRVPSAYNKFIKEEIQRIKDNNPHISHKQAFSTAAKNWAHFPRIHFGQTFDGNKLAKLDEPVAAPGCQKGQSFF
ncbi:protein YABBY 2-like isoform X1 [Musa acuminata AAA Group]|uniref:protein YABBY 2-like isoform X1 n=1 Tax=Musa acuminata AAA Group TaxID=214697 RepID=UPI0031E0B7CB